MSGNEQPENLLLIQFKKETLEKAITGTKLASLAASTFFPLFIILDYFVYPELFFQFLVIRIAVVAASLANYLLAKNRIGTKYARELTMLEYLICSLAIVIMVHITGDCSSPYYAGINLVILAFLFIAPLDLKRTAIVCIIAYAAYLAPILIRQHIENISVLLNNNFFLIATMLVVVLSSHLATQMRFREFSARFNLEKANAELKQLDELKTRFFANVSHEVRTPLTSIIAPIQSMYSGDAGELTLDHQDMVAQVYRNSLRLLNMINQMLDFSKFDAGKMQLRLEKIDLPEIVQDTIAIFQEVTKRKGIELIYKQQDEVPQVFMDIDKVERILTNLLRNAIKFTHKGSIYIEVGKNNGSLLLQVKDTGIGIPADHLDNIFKRFQQVDSSTTRHYEGTGLGLTIVKESVDLLRGSISVSSQQGKGTVFQLQLPVNLEELEPNAFRERRDLIRRKQWTSFQGNDKREKIRRYEDHAKVTIDDLALIDRHESIVRKEDEESADIRQVEKTDRILLVEDNPDLRSYVKKMLDRFGHGVTTAVDGLDGWQQIEKDPPDLIVSDVMMPKMDGYELTDKVKSTSATMHIPIILITAKPGLESKLKGLETGADDYLPKPINVRELDARINNLITMRKFQHALAEAEALDTRMEELSMSFAQSLEIRDFKTGGHSRDVLHLGSIIAEGLNIPLDHKLKDSLLLHDIGKIGIPDSILLKELPLDDEEWRIMKKHPEIGYNLLKNFDSYKEVSRIILAHQEHYNGTGYPKELTGNTIPLIARIIGVADAYHAMTNDRPYRKALSTETAIAELLKYSGSQFDPQIVEGFVNGLVKYELITGTELAAARALLV